MPKISVIIPTYNRCHLLPRAVKSAQQAGSDVEIIVVDDASTDDTPKVCQALEEIRYLRMQDNIGQAAARNAGIEASTAAYIAFLDDDDLRLPETLDLQVQYLEENLEAGFVYGQVLIGDSNCEPTGKVLLRDFPEGDIFWKLLVSNFLLPSSVIIRKKCLIDIGLFDLSFTPENIICEDYDLWLRLAEKYSAIACRNPVAIYRRATASSGQSTSDEEKLYEANKRIQAKGLLFSKAINDPEKCRQTLHEIRNVESDMFIWRADSLLSEGSSLAAFKRLVSAVKLNPFRAVRPWTLQLLIISIFRILFVHAEN